VEIVNTKIVVALKQLDGVPEVIFDLDPSRGAPATGHNSSKN